MDRPTVLVIDYEPRNIAATVEPLTAAGYHVEVARDGIAGLDAFRRLHPPVVFMEAMLPKKHAFEVCQEIRRSQPGRKTLVFILGAPTIAHSQQMKAVRQYGADRFLPRPVDGETLVSLCSPLLPGPSAPQVPEIDLMQPISAKAGLPLEEDLLPAPQGAVTPRGPLDLSHMSEDAIMAQLDQLLPSIPVPTPLASAEPKPAPRKQSIPVAPKAPSPAPARSIPVTPRAASPAPTRSIPLAAAPRAVAPAPKPRAVASPAPTITRPPLAPERAVMPPPVLVQSPAPEVRFHSAETAPAPAPRRSRVPMVLVGCVLVAAAFGSWMLLRPGAAPVVDPVHTLPFQGAASSESTPSAPTAVLEEAPPVAESAPLQAEPAPLHVRPAPVVAPPSKAASHETALQPKKETAPAEKAVPPPAPKTVTATLAPAPQPTSVQPPSNAASTTSSGETAGPDTTAADVPLPLAPPRLEPLPVGSDAARPRMSPDVFVTRARWGSLVELQDVDKPPVVVNRPAPIYPPAARQMRREGEIEMRLLIDAQGQVAAVEVLTGGRSDFAMAAERAARRWKYRPAIKDGVPVQVKIVEKVSFKL